MQNKTKLLSLRKLWLYPAKKKKKKKADNHTKIISSNNVFLTSLSTVLKPLCLLEIDWFFSYRFLNEHSILLDGVYCVNIKFISSYLLTTRLDTKKSKTKWKKQIVASVVSKTVLKCNRWKSCFKSLLQWWISNPMN